MTVPGRRPGAAARRCTGRWRPSSVTPQAASFARAVVAAAGPHRRERAKNLLWAAGKLADYGIGLGLDPVPLVLLHPSVIERFTAHAPGLTSVTRRTLRTNLRFIARAVVPQLCPADAPLPRERAKAPYSPAEISGYLALADAQPTAARRMRAAGLVSPGAGAGLIRADLRAVRGTDITCRSGGVTVQRARRPAARRCRRWPATTSVLLASADFAGDQLVTGGTDPRAGTSRARWPGPWPAAPGCPGSTPAGCARPGWPTARKLLGLATFLHAAGISCSQRLGDIIATLDPGTRPGRWHCSAPPAGEHPAALTARGHHRRLRRRAADRGAAARCRPAPPAEGPHLTAWACSSPWPMTGPRT